MQFDNQNNNQNNKQDDKKYKSIIEQLPEVVKEGKKVFNKIMARINNNNHIEFQINEFVYPNPDVITQDLYNSNDVNSTNSNFINKLIYGDNLLSLSALLSLKNQGKLSNSSNGGG